MRSKGSAAEIMIRSLKVIRRPCCEQDETSSLGELTLVEEDSAKGHVPPEPEPLVHD